MKRFFLFLFVIVLISSCKSNQVTAPSIQGMIYNDNNEPVSDVRIHIDNKQVAISDIYGHFTLSHLDYGETYTLSFIKENYESVKIDLSYLNHTQVIYVHMFSAKELLAKAEDKVKQKDYNEALALLERSSNTGGNFLSINYLTSVIYYIKKDHEKALNIAQEILNLGYKDFYVYLLLADIYEYGLNDIEKAQEYLKTALSISYDPVIQKRIINE